MKLALLILAAAGIACAGDAVTVAFREVDTVFQNPGKGWMAFGRLPRKTTRFPCSVGYFRLNWGDIEPEEGRPNWTLIDQAIAAWKARGAAVAFRIMTTNAHSRGYYCSPKWLFDAGCRSFDYVRGGTDTMAGGTRIQRIEPDYADPIYLGKHGAFIAALGKRYNGHPQVEFLDIGSYGIWGEWHTSHGASAAVRKQIIDMYLKAFDRTPLAMMSDDAEMLGYALSKGTGFRRDGVGSPWHEKNWIGSKKYARVRGFADAWKRAPVVFEWYGPYDFLQRRKWSFDRAVQFMLDSHLTLVNDNVGAVPEADMAKLWELARRAGYRFVLRSLSHPPKARRGAAVDVAMQWSNVGVGRLFRPFVLQLALLDAEGQAVATAEGKADPRQWLPGNHAITETLAVPPDLQPGSYALAVALVEPKTKRPAVKLAIDAPETDRRYTVSTLAVE